MAKGDTFGDTFRVAKQVRGCQNLGEIQANTTDNPLPERAIPTSEPPGYLSVLPADFPRKFTSNVASIDRGF